MDGVDLVFEEVLEHHRQVFAHIKNREPQKAYDAMHNHLVFVQEFFEKRNVVQDSIPLKHLAA